MQPSAKILKYLVENNISQADVSRKTSIKRSRLNLMLHGKRRMPVDDYNAIVKALGLTGREFLDLKAENSNSD